MAERVTKPSITYVLEIEDRGPRVFASLLRAVENARAAFDTQLHLPQNSMAYEGDGAELATAFERAVAEGHGVVFSLLDVCERPSNHLFGPRGRRKGGIRAVVVPLRRDE